MIGLHISKDRFYVENKHLSVQKKCAGLFVTLSHHPLDYRQVFFENEKIVVFVDGWIFNSPDYNEQALFVAQKYWEYGNSFSEYIEGQFNILIWDKTSNSTIFTNDIFALRKHFVIVETFEISTDIEFLYGHLESIKFNESHIQKNLNQNRLIDIAETFVEEINMVRPTSIIDFETCNFYSFERFEIKYSYKSVTPESFVTKVRENIDKVHRGKNILLELSGGMDSRFLVESFKILNLPTKTLSYGLIESDELKIAEAVALCNETAHIQISYQAADFIKNASNYQFKTGGLDIFVQSAFQKIIDELQLQKLDNHVLETGIGLNNFIGGTQIPHQFEVFSNNFSEHIFDLSKNDIYTSELRIFSQLFLRQSFHREFMEDRYAMFSYANYFLIKSIPITDLANYKFYDRVAEIAIINSREVNIQATMLPFYKTPDAENKRKLKEVEGESLDSFLNENKLKPHNRYYSDFDMWLRANATWLELIESSILKKQAHICTFIENETLQKIVQQHKDGVKNNMRLIIRLISTELFFQETVKYFKNKGNA